MAFVAFDIEIAKDIPDEERDWMALAPLGIACVALMRHGESEPLLRFNPRQHQDYYEPTTSAMNRQALDLVIDELVALADRGDTLVTWNGTSFDFQVLALESGRRKDCARLALASIDMMFWLVCQRGHPLALDTALAGMGLGSKLHEVELAGGGKTVINGKEAPRLWRAGEFEAVLTYCGGDVRRTLELSLECQRQQKLRWISRRGAQSIVPLGTRWPTVRECLELPVPDTSWMTNPLDRRTFVNWMSPFGVKSRG